MKVENIYWNLFRDSGSIHAYLAYKELCVTKEIKNNNKLNKQETLGWLYGLNKS